jgi:hypothetical protein
MLFNNPTSYFNYLLRAILGVSDQQLLEETEAYKIFINGIDSDATKESYRKTFP